jgi:hypothetical protein
MDKPRTLNMKRNGSAANDPAAAIQLMGDALDGEVSKRWRDAAAVLECLHRNGIECCWLIGPEVDGEPLN